MCILNTPVAKIGLISALFVARDNGTTHDTECAGFGVHSAGLGTLMKRFTFGLICAIALVGTPKQVSATTLATIDFLGFGKAQGLSATPSTLPIRVTLTDAAVAGTPLVGFNGRSVTAGELNWNFNPDPPYGYTDTFYAYCAELTEPVLAQQNVELLSTDLLIPTNPPGSGDAFSGKKAAWLFNTYAPGIHAAVNDLDSRENAAALQVAIWEAIYDTTNDIADGFFRLNSAPGAVAAKAVTYLTALYGQTTYSEGTWFKTANGQDLIAGHNAVPEPGTLLLFGLGLAGLAQLRARQRTARQASSNTLLS